MLVPPRQDHRPRQLSAERRAQVLPGELWALVYRGQEGGKFPLSHVATSLFGFGSSRKILLTVRAMDLVTSTAALSLLFGCVGIFSLFFKMLQCMRMKAHLQDAVVVITGATSGLGRGGSRS